MSIPSLRLKKDQERRLLAGHCWIFSNEVDTRATALKAFDPGQPVQVLSHRGRWLGQGYVNPNSLICARILTRRRKQPLSPTFWLERIRTALELRERLYAHPFYRLIFGESDGLPGLTVDRYGDLLAVQITTAGMERVRVEVLTALEHVLRPKAIVLRNDTQVRELEGLPQGVETVLGEAPDDLELQEAGTRFVVSVLSGQKTGWFYDQAENRMRLPRFGAPSRVLDLCSYVGAWGVQAAVAGAEEVVCVDSSPTALERVGENADRNGVAARARGIQGDAFDVLRALRDQQERFDLVILDPPAFVKRRKDTNEGTQAYERLNRLGLELVEPGGLIVTSSCSFHIDRDTFLRIVQKAARRCGRSLQLLEAGGQGPDHPIHPAIPETGYLKTFFLRVLPEL
ncbi:MAG: class I SAM-dependent rRNA methyltransferase [Chromatiaceae bacterium]|nr:class I SAM-dependent rRNA methyltransferase [Chromatiaceae bacterium]